ncbi:polysaccharide deacetylase [Paenibacillus pinistramenti]|uniref:polysaccharide deacetylase n=1 Tax=Paenibacillus pinistramenti TaxID=1768003 RepID=UPI001EF0CD49|nr:polysaccharide deacetylase [Paenibacillus pinistramenti]
MYRKSWIVIMAAAALLAAAAFLVGGPAWGIGGVYKPNSAKAASLTGLIGSTGSAQAFQAAPVSWAAQTSEVSQAVQASLVTPAPLAAKTAGSNAKTVYLTFDDGPSKLTAGVLNILNRYKVKATFFVLGQQAQHSPELIRQIEDGGHAVGNHSFDHNYDKLYHNFSDFWGQIKQTEEILRNITGSRPQLVRAPGGTYGHFDQTYFSLMDQAGYKVFDWNVDSGDSARKGVPASDILKQATESGGLQQVVLLMHDGGGHENTVKALPKIIEYYQAKGYSFATLTPDVKPVQFRVGGSIPQNRQEPSQAWIDSHITPNAALFDSRILPLALTAGGVQTVLNGGEYEMSGGRFMVPLRTTMERLGGKVSWNPDSGQAEVKWGKGRLMLRPDQGLDVHSSGNTLWVSLRSLLEGLGHPVVKVAKAVDGWQVKAS